jgi:bacterioferritin (cytochrome b1)
MNNGRYKIGQLLDAVSQMPPEESGELPQGEGPVAGMAEEPRPQPTASEGVHPLAVSPEEGMFAVPQEKIVAQCQKLLKLKYTTHLAYMNYGDRIRAHFRDPIYEHFGEHMGEERTDAYHLAMKITALGGEPTPKVGTVPDINDLHQIFMTLLQMEKQLIQELRNLSLMAGENLSLKVMLEQMVLTDQQHADDLRRMMFCEGGSGGTTPQAGI